MTRSSVELLLDDVEALRQATIASKADTPELRSLLRSIVHRIESMQGTPQVPQSTYLAVTDLLSQLLNPE